LVLAQTAPPAEPLPESKAAPATTQPRPREAPGRLRLESVARRLAAELQLDESQKARFDEVVAGLQQQSGVADPDDQLRALMADLQAAREQQDHDRVADLARQIRELRGGGDAGIEKLFDAVASILREDQQPALARFRERWNADRRRGAAGANRLERAVRRLEDELNLTDEQRPQFDALVEQYRERFAAQAKTRAAQDEERAKLLAELRAARDGGDVEKVRDLEQQLAERRDDDLALLNEFLHELEGVLGEDQRVVLERYRDRNAVPGGDVNDVRTVLRAARRLRLEPEQREKLREIERATIQSVRELSGDRAGREALTARTREAILAFLTDEQKVEFEKHLSRDARRGGDARPDRAPENEPEKP
jgi:hypothetical protein